MSSTAPSDKELRYDVEYFDPGWISETDDPAKGPVGFDYDAEGRQILRQPTANLPETWAYYADGLLRSNTDAGGQLTDFLYDLNGNLDSSADSGVDHATEASLETELDYNGFDEATEVRQREVGEASWQTTRYTFDRNGNLDTRTDEAGSGNERAHDFEYDAADRLLWQRDNAGTGCADDRRLSYSYSPADRLLADVTRVAGAGCGADPAAWPVSQQTAYGYTVNGDLKTQQTWKSATQDEASLLEEHTLGYLTAGGVYLNGNRLSDQFRLKGPDSQCASAACTATYAYDARERLVRTDNGLPNGFKTVTNYTLDGQAGLPLQGNVTREVTQLTKVGGGIDRVVTDSSYNAASQMLSSGSALTSYSGTEPALPAYPLAPTNWQRWNQANGNLKCVTSSAAVTLADCQKPEAQRPATIDAWYQFDVRDRMTRYSAVGDKASYVYDGADRVAKQWEQHTRGAETRARDTDYAYLGLSAEVVRETHWNALNKQPYEAIGQGALLQKTRGYGYDAYERRTTMTNTPSGGATSSYSYARNVHGDISLLLGSTGTATAAYGYTAYGAEEDGLTTNAESTIGNGFQQTEPLNAFRFNDKRYDTGSLSIDMGARRYGPDTGRFLQNDYYRGAFDDVSLSTDPLTGNRYGFAGGNPISFVETDGHVFGPPMYADPEGACGGNSPCAQRTGNFVLNALRYLSGGADLFRCLSGSATACGVFAAGVVPIGKAIRLARIGAKGGDSSQAVRLVQEAYEEKANSVRLRKNLGNPTGGYAHHIVAWGEESALPTKNILLGHGIGPNDAVNGIIIQKPGRHPRGYHEVVENRIRKAVASARDRGWEAERRAILAELRRIKRDIRRWKAPHMITFYTVRADLDSFQHFVVDDELSTREPFDGRPLFNLWRPPRIRMLMPNLQVGAFTGVMGIGGASFAVFDDVREHGHLSIFLDRAGELLPLLHDERPLHVLNVTECRDALDAARSEWAEPGGFDEADLDGYDEATKLELRGLEDVPTLEVPHFRQDRLGWQIFKIPETAITDIYYWERSEDGPDEQFRAYCQREGLKGLLFEELYTANSEW